MTAQFPRRTTSWRMIGTRAEWRAGDWIGRTDNIGGTADPNYIINGVAETILIDYQKSETTIGGILTEYAIG